MPPRERTRDLVDLFRENDRRWNPSWNDLPKPSGGCYKGNYPLDEELDELDETDESED